MKNYLILLVMITLSSCKSFQKLSCDELPSGAVANGPRNFKLFANGLRDSSNHYDESAVPLSSCSFKCPVGTTFSGSSCIVQLSNPQNFYLSGQSSYSRTSNQDGTEITQNYARQLFSYSAETKEFTQLTNGIMSSSSINGSVATLYNYGIMSGLLNVDLTGAVYFRGNLPAGQQSAVVYKYDPLTAQTTDMALANPEVTQYMLELNSDRALVLNSKIYNLSANSQGLVIFDLVTNNIVHKTSIILLDLDLSLSRPMQLNNDLYFAAIDRPNNNTKLMKYNLQTEVFSVVPGVDTVTSGVSEFFCEDAVSLGEKIFFYGYTDNWTKMGLYSYDPANGMVAVSSPSPVILSNLTSTKYGSLLYMTDGPDEITGDPSSRLFYYSAAEVNPSLKLLMNSTGPTAAHYSNAFQIGASVYFVADDGADIGNLNEYSLATNQMIVREEILNPNIIALNDLIYFSRIAPDQSIEVFSFDTTSKITTGINTTILLPVGALAKPAGL